jgi:hypothetical protein
MVAALAAFCVVSREAMEVASWEPVMRVDLIFMN